MSPPYVNGTKHWRMEPLREAWTDRESSSLVYIVNGPRRHYSADPDQRCGTALVNRYERVF